MKTETVGHTPGPWIARASEYVDAVEEWWVTADGYRVVVGAVGYGGPRTEANARLIAAAPDLFEALRKMVHHAEIGPADDRRWEEDCSPLGFARKALAKARGEPKS